MIEYTVKYGQSLWDIAIQEYGHVHGVELLVKDNPQLSVTGVPAVGSKVLIRPEVPELSNNNQRNVAEYKKQNITVASNAPATATLRRYVISGYVVNGYVLNKFA